MFIAQGRIDIKFFCISFISRFVCKCFFFHVCENLILFLLSLKCIIAIK